MKTFSAETNDGTIIISRQFERPSQGTLVIEEEGGGVIIAKGISRPPLKDPVRGIEEEESHADVGAFKKPIPSGAKGVFYNLNALGKERARLGYQTVLFASKHPAEFIRKDNQRLLETTILDLLSRDDKRRVNAGVSPALLVQDIAPWDLLRQFSVNAVRATAYGSELVPSKLKIASYKQRLDEAFNFEAAFESIEGGWPYSSFMLLPNSAIELARQVGCEVYEMIGRWFLIHRDPALADGTSLTPMQFAGVLEWAVPCHNKYGVVFHPADPYWKNMGGDLDGDAAVVIEPSAVLLPRGALPRRSYRKKTGLYATEDLFGQMLEAAADSFTKQLGPITLGAMRLVERGIATDDVRICAASAAQASVEKKKHAVDVVSASADAAYVADLVRQHGYQAYLSTYLNELRNAKGLADKQVLWNKLIDDLDIWEDGTDIEQAMCERVRAVDQLYKDVNYFRYRARPELPPNIQAAAKAKCSTRAAQAVRELAATYRQLAFNLSEDIIEEEDERRQYRSSVRNDLANIRNIFMLGYTTGNLNGLKSTPEDIQYAVIAYAPVRVAVKCPPERFEELGTSTARAMINLKDSGWETKEYNKSELRPIPSCEADLAAISSERVRVEVISVSSTGRSTRVMVSSC